MNAQSSDRKLRAAPHLIDIGAVLALIQIRDVQNRSLSTAQNKSRVGILQSSMLIEVGVLRAATLAFLTSRSTITGSIE
jgi:hypothetical protein